MKGVQGRGRHRRGWRLTALALLLPLALASAETPLRWPGTPVADPAPSASAPAARAVPPAQYAIRSPATAIPRMSPAQGFEVAEFERLAERLVADRRVPGLALAIVQGGRVLSARGYGITDTYAGEPVDVHTVFRLASLSKGFAGTLTGLLVADGSLRWDSRVRDYLPEFRLQDPYASHKVTVADVLSHRLGLPHNTYDRDIERYADYRTLTRRLAEAPLTCRPGECYAYQNVAFSLVGDLALAATGRSYEDLLRERLFAPLGMRDASVGLDGILASPRWARPHVRGRNGWVPLSPKPTYYQLAPAAGVNASAADMAQWLIAQTGHRPDVLPAPLLATLHAPIVATPGETRGSSWRRERLSWASYALGWRVYDYAGHRLVFHGGAVQGYRGLIALLPERDLGVAILWNSESSAPSGLLPTILDRAIGLAPGRWLDIEPEDATLFARRQEDAAATPATDAKPPSGMDASHATAAPR